MSILGIVATTGIMSLLVAGCGITVAALAKLGMWEMGH